MIVTLQDDRLIPVSGNLCRLLLSLLCYNMCVQNIIFFSSLKQFKFDQPKLKHRRSFKNSSFFFFLLSALKSLLSPENPLPPNCSVAQGSNIYAILVVPGCKIHPKRVTNLTINESVGSKCQLVDVTCQEELPSATSLISKTLISGQWNCALQVPLGESAFSCCS